MTLTDICLKGIAHEEGCDKGGPPNVNKCDQQFSGCRCLCLAMAAAAELREAGVTPPSH